MCIYNIYICTHSCLFQSGLDFCLCPINRFRTRTTFLGKPSEFLLIYCCQVRFSAAKMSDQTAKIPDHVGWQFLTTASIFRNGVFPFLRCFWAAAEISTIGRSRYTYVSLSLWYALLYLPISFHARKNGIASSSLDLRNSCVTVQFSKSLQTRWHIHACVLDCPHPSLKSTHTTTDA